MLAHLSALAAGAEYLETDVRATADGIAVLCHDPDLERVAGAKLIIEESTLAQLQQVDLGQGQRIPTLAEFLDAFPDARVNLDLKSSAAVGPAVAVIRRARAIDRVLIGSFSNDRRRRAVSGLQGVATSASRWAATTAMFAARFGLGFLLPLVLRGVDAVQVPAHAGPLSLSGPRTIRRLHRAGVEVHYWTVNEPGEIARLLRAGADGVVTDRIDLALRVWAELKHP